ncbi:uncharacterized protein B0T23DRAFT_158251 [Neurospora hispaniola]|uniref:Uncharacterized protein n=1 Tax=Neurospora hispaniola TaxID=588809 RepID=A0AAJ0I4U2_9PEZI|nr:hypothetical protein B0T23DRAFT_158251 [Neurospora hispaniola]
MPSHPGQGFPGRWRKKKKRRRKGNDDELTRLDTNTNNMPCHPSDHCQMASVVTDNRQQTETRTQRDETKRNLQRIMEPANACSKGQPRLFSTWSWSKWSMVQSLWSSQVLLAGLPRLTAAAASLKTLPTIRQCPRDSKTP